MAATFTHDEIRDAALVLVVDEDGNYRWSATKTDDQVADVLERIATRLRDDEDQIGDFDCCIPGRRTA